MRDTGSPSGRDGGRGPIVARVRRVGGDREQPSGRPSMRPARADDLAACAEVWATALSDYRLRLNQPAMTGDLAPLGRLLGHVLETDPGRFWVATRPERQRAPHDDPGDRAPGVPARVVGFGSAVVRGSVWFLSMLFILPEEQTAGLGRALLERTLAGSPGPDPRSGGRAEPEPPTAWSRAAAAFADGRTLATVTDSAQPVSNALYSRLGIVPRMPLVHLVGRPGSAGRSTAGSTVPALPAGIRPVAFDALAAGPPGGPGHRELVDAVAAIDRAILGYEHPEDHRFHRLEGRVGFLYRGPDGAPVGYGYTSPVGRLGPIATLDPALLAPLVGHLLDAVAPRGASSVWLPGAADGTLRAMLEVGLRIEDFPALVCWNRPFARFEGYIPGSLGLL